MSEIHGLINLIKPPGITSFGVVAWVKKNFHCKKVGHTGTLDPAATGVLPVCLGKATKVIPYISNDKEYIGELSLGIITDTLDAAGKILKSNDSWKKLSNQEIKEAFNQFKGQIEQIPPMYSAIHYQGKRLYELAREGKIVERKSRQVEIKEINILGIELPKIRFQVSCSKGTYIRSLVSDIGEKLGCGAYLSFLIRTRSGPFKINNGFTLEEISLNKEKYILPLDYPLDFPKLMIKDRAVKKACNGVNLIEDDFLNWPYSLKLGDYILIYDSKGICISLNKLIFLSGKMIKCKPVRVLR